MLNELTLTQAIKLIKQKKISLNELYKDLSNHISKSNDKLNVYLTVNKNLSKSKKTKQDSTLYNLPIAVKDNFCTQHMRTTASSKILDNFIPQYESTVTEKIKQAQGFIVGKTNLDAWAHGSSTETSDYGRTLNPRNTKHLPGGSSGGSAAAVASNMCLAAIGSETAGSVRQPASWCGIVGLKPTYGRVSRYGVIAMASSTDSPGPMTKTVKDAAYMLNIIAGHDSKDGTTVNKKVPNYLNYLKKDIKDLKIGVLYLDIKGLENIKPLLEKQLKIFTNLGAKVEPVKALDPNYAISVYTIVQRAEVSSNLARFDGIRLGASRDQFGDEAKRRIMLGTFTLSKGYADQYYNLAQKVRTLFIQDFGKLFAKYDVLISPSSPGFAKQIGATENSVMFGELEDMLLEPSSIAGLPGINVPCYHDPKTNLFLGFNIVAPMYREDLMIKTAYAFEQAAGINEWIHNDK